MQSVDNADRIALQKMLDDTLKMGQDNLNRARELEVQCNECQKNVERCAGAVNTLRALLVDYDTRHGIVPSLEPNP